MRQNDNRQHDIPPLDRWRADEVLDRRLNRREAIWGLSEIANAIGVGVDKARELAKRDDVPITRPPGSKRYFAFRSELMAWLRGKTTHENP